MPACRMPTQSRGHGTQQSTTDSVLAVVANRVEWVSQQPRVDVGIDFARGQGEWRRAAGAGVGIAIDGVVAADVARGEDERRRGAGR